MEEMFGAGSVSINDGFYGSKWISFEKAGLIWVAGATAVKSAFAPSILGKMLELMSEWIVQPMSWEQGCDLVNQANNAAFTLAAAMRSDLPKSIEIDYHNKDIIWRSSVLTQLSYDYAGGCHKWATCVFNHTVRARAMLAKAEKLGF